jgi:hypothetical protein
MHAPLPGRGAASLEQRCALVAVALVAGQLALAVLQLHTSWFAALPAVVAVGLALVPWLPAELRASHLALAALVAPIGAIALDLAMISVGGIGLPFTATSACIVLVLFAAVGLYGAQRTSAVQPRAVPEQHLAWLAAAGALLCALGLALVVNHALPPVGNDWAKYLLYADEIRAQHHTIIENRFWLLGQPFREDPGVPALYATFLVLSGGSAGGLGWGIVVLLLLAALATIGCLVALFGTRAGLLGSFAFALAPATADMSAWHGAANMLGLVAMPLCLLPAGMLLRGSRDMRWCGLLGLGIVGVVCAHRLSSLITLAALGVVAAVWLLRQRGAAWPALWRTALAVAALGALPAVDLERRAQRASGVLSYTQYLTSKIYWPNVARDMTWPIVVLVVGAAFVLARRRSRDPVVGIALALGAVTFAYTYSYLVHFPGFYARATYFMPIAIALLIAAAATALPLRRLLLVAVPAFALSAVLAVGTAANSREFYLFVDRPALRGFDQLASRLRPGQTVLTDRCTSFITAWLIKTPMLGALRDDEIGPAAELPRVRQARAIMSGSAQGRALARRLHTGWLVVDPTCPGRIAHPPPFAAPIYISQRLVVFRLDVPRA